MPDRIIDLATTDNKLILSYIFVFLHINQIDELYFTKQQFYDFVSVKSNKYQKIRLESLHKVLSIFSDSVKDDDRSYLDVTRNELIKVEISDKIYDFPKGTLYSSISIDIFRKIMKHANKGASVDKTLLFYIHYKKKVIKRNHVGYTIDDHPQIYYDFIENIASYLKLSVPTLNKIIKLLDDLDIIRTKKIANCPYVCGWVNGKTLFTDYTGDKNSEYTWEDELAYGEKYVISISKKKFN